MAASDNLKDYRDKIRELMNLSAARANESVIVPAANKMLAMTKNRIQVDGKNSTDRHIGTYSQNPMYATKDQFIKTSAFKAGGKPKKVKPKAKAAPKKIKFEIQEDGTRKKVTISPKKKAKEKKQKPKSMYLIDGYKQFRAIQGRPVGRVNLTYTGDLMASYQMQVKQDEILIGLVSEQSAIIRQGLEEGKRRKLGYGKIFEPTITEMTNYKDEVAKGLKKVIVSIMKPVSSSTTRKTPTNKNA